MQAFETIFKDYSPVVFRFLLSLCGDEKLAEEVTAETFYQAYLHIGKFRGDCKLETWLCQIAKNALYKEQKRRGQSADLGDLEHIAASNDLFEAISNKEQAIQICKHLHLLKEPYREVFMLRVFLALRFSEIADVFGKTEVWAKITFYRAKGKLIKDMEEEL